MTTCRRLLHEEFFVKYDEVSATYNLLNGGVAYFPQTANNCIVSLNGVIQSPTSAYIISGSTIVFSDALIFSLYAVNQLST